MADRVQSISTKPTPLPVTAIGSARRIENAILVGLPRKERASVLSKSDFVQLPPRTILTEMARPIEFCYFLNSGVASIIHVMEDGKSVEVGLTGKEGFI